MKHLKTYKLFESEDPIKNLVVYHGTNEKFEKFDFDKTAEGVIWFTDSIESIKNGTHGGDGSKYILTRKITLNNPAGWDEYEKMSIGELIGAGYDGVILPEEDKTDYIVFELGSISESTLFESDTFYHGSTDMNMSGKQGIHVGTYEAAKQALEARIGVPAEGEWDGTRKYGETLLAGENTLTKPENRWKSTGYNTGDVPEEDYYPGDRKTKAMYSDRTEIPMDSKPVIFPVKIVGRMTNTTSTPHEDFRANGLMNRALKRGNAKSGFYYENVGEDEGSISAVVPDKSFLQIL